MMTQQLGFSILSAPLAAIDRRALSQAWYSALHLAHAHASVQTDVRACAHATDVADAEKPHASRQAFGTQVQAQVMQRASGAKSQGIAIVERRAGRSTLARRIERTFLNPFVRPQRATFTIDGSAARVHIALQTTPGGARIVAVCPASMQARVSRALEQARYALAVRGIAVHADVSEA